MYILMLIAIGIVVLAAFILVARSLNEARARAVDGALLFIWGWLIASRRFPPNCRPARSKPTSARTELPKRKR